MKLLFMIGNTSVGKMTVGQELTKITGLRLFHNHMTIEPVLEIFGGFETKVIQRLRQIIFEEFAQSDREGMIFTFMWAFDCREDWDFIDGVRQTFLEKNPTTEFYYVELVADQQTRLERNATENRLKYKASKRDIEASNARLLREDEKYRLESLPGEIPYENYLRIDNTKLSPEEAAKQIKTHFKL